MQVGIWAKTGGECEAEAKAKGWHTLRPGSWQAGDAPMSTGISAVARVLGPVGRSRLLQKRLRASQPVCVSATEHRLSRASQSGLFQPDTFSLRIQLINIWPAGIRQCAGRA